MAANPWVVESLRAITGRVKNLKRWPVWLLAALAATAGMAALVGAGCACFPVGCIDPLVIKVLPQSGSFPAAGNRIVAEFDGQMVECQFTWPRDANERCGNESVFFPIKVPPDNSVEVTFSGRPRRPARVKLRYTAGAVSVENEFVVKYQERESNIDTCGPPCPVARETWMVP